MPALAQEWLNLLVRWLHVIAAIMWVGDSFLFMWLDSHLSPPGSGKPRDGAVTGELWMTHSGGFYEVIKRKSLAKGEAVGTLYWFKWESYTTWLSGFLLLAIVYYGGSASLLIDSQVAALSQAQAVAVSLGALPLGVLLYEAMWLTPLAKSQRAFAAVGLLVITGLAYAFTHVFSGRGAFLQVGAMVGTVMAANVFFRIIPAQRHMLAATAAGTPVDTSYGLRAKGRSIQNHYLTLPVLFTMLSNHFASTYGNDRPWLVLSLLFVVGAGVKYLMNFRERSAPFVPAGTALALVAVVVLTVAPWQKTSLEAGPYANSPKVSFATVNTIVQSRCLGCHAAKPSNPMFNSAPSGMVFETPEQIRGHAERMYMRCVVNKTMPMANMTGMLPEERELFGAWVAQGADIHAEGPVAMPLGAIDGGAPVHAGPSNSTASATELARERFTTTCVACHGERGDGNGPAAGSLPVKPRDYTDAAWQRSVTDADLRSIIVRGGAAVGKSPMMPAQPDLADQPQVLDALVAIVRGFGPTP